MEKIPELNNMTYNFRKLKTLILLLLNSSNKEEEKILSPSSECQCPMTPLCPIYGSLCQNQVVL